MQNQRHNTSVPQIEGTVRLKSRLVVLQIKRTNRLLRPDVTSVSSCIAYKIIITKDW